MVPQRPPRPISPGDIVAVHSDVLGEWTASQVTHVDPDERTAGVLELDWSGPEPASLADIGDVRPLRLTHHSWGGTLSHCTYEWVLPRSFKLVGTVPPLVTERSRSYSTGWGRGLQLALQRRWDSGSREPWTDPHLLECTGAALALGLTPGPAPALASAPAPALDRPRPDVRTLRVSGVEEIDCARLAACYPNLTSLALFGELGTLTSPASLNDLTRLRAVHLTDVFGMTAADCLVPRQVPALEALHLHSVPADYATATRKAWRAELPHGVHLSISSPRKPEWVAANLTNPLRDWDGREHIPRQSYRRAVAQYEATRREFLAAVAEGADRERIFEIGVGFGEGFNELDRRWEFIATIEREELYDALDAMAREVRSTVGRDLGKALESLLEGVDSARDW